MNASKTKAFILMLAGCTAYAWLSPKWTMPVFAWVWPACLAYYTRQCTLKRKYLWLAAGITAAQTISSAGVAPFPWPLLAIVALFNSLKMVLICGIDAWVAKKCTTFVSTLALPALFTAKQAVEGIGGNWWSIGNTQLSFPWFAQLSSVTGWAGIVFMLYWFGSVVAWVCGRMAERKTWHAATWYVSLLALVIFFGAWRVKYLQLAPANTVRIAGVTVPNNSFMEALCKDVYGTEVSISPRVSPASAQLQKASAAMIPFIESPSPTRFKHAFKALAAIHDSLFSLGEKAVVNGAQVIVWSEANALMPRSMNDSFIARAKEFSARNKVYLLMTMGVFDTGKITPAKMFLENKAILLGPGGNVITEFHKNFPVPFAERSTPGDGNIPVIPTPFGNLAISICYDADMPANMRQLGEKKADILLLPSGDWYNISPYHSYMAVFRGIENGCSIFRQASGGLSLATGATGQTQQSFNYFTPCEKLWITNVKTGHIKTIYNTIGDVLPNGCIILSCLLILYRLIMYVMEKRRRRAAKAMQDI